MSRIIVNGIDGNFGALVFATIKELVAKEDLIVTCPSEGALVDCLEAGYDGRVANFNDPVGLQQVFSGGDVMLLISAPFVGAKRQQAHKNAVDAAISAGVGKIVYVSLVNATDPDNPSIEKIDHAYTENYISSLDVDYIFLRNSQYAEAMISAYMTSGGAIPSCQGDGKMAYISRQDCAMAAAYALTKDDLHHTILNINGAEAMTLTRFIAIGNEKTGMNVTMKDVSEEEMYAAFDAMGVPRTTDGDFQKGSPAPFSSDGMVTFARAIRLDKMSTFTDDFETLTGKKPRTVAYMFEHYNDYLVGNRHSTDE